jgi:hypothetical protein
MIIILSVGCLKNDKNNNDEKKIEIAKSNDLKLKIELYKNYTSIKKLNVNDTYFDMNIKLINKNNNSIKIDNFFYLSHNIKGKIIGPNNDSYTISTKGGPNPIHKIIILQPGEYLEWAIAGNILIVNGTMNISSNLEKLGRYQVQCWYIDVEPWVYSNIVYLDIIK